MAQKLSIDLEEETNYSVIGISSILKDYKLIFLLNKLGDFDFKRVDTFVFNIKKQDFLYSMYTFIDDFNLQNFYLLSNKANSVKLVPDFKHFDYILILDGEFEEDYVSQLVQNIKSVSGVMLASKMDFNSINKVPNLSLSFEMHLDKIFKNK
jgi:hypothetical protein